MADCLKTAVFPPGHVIIKQGDPGNEFYIIEEGEVVCTKEGVDQPLCKLKVGDYFGEIALLTNQPRAATVAAVGLVRVCIHCYDCALLCCLTKKPQATPSLYSSSIVYKFMPVVPFLPL